MHRSETSVVFYESYHQDIFTTLTTSEINLFYELLEVASLQFLGVYTKEYVIDIDKLPHNYERTIKKLRSMIMVVNYHRDNNIVSREDINLLRKTKFTENKLYFSIEKEILKPYIHHRKEFDYIFIKIDWALKSKYAKFLYRILIEHRDTDYKIHYEMLIMLMNLSNPKYIAARAYNVFNRDVLKKCVEEINNWTDIKVDYYPIKSKKDNKTVEYINFEIATQETKDHIQEISEQEQMDIAISQMIEEKALTQFNKALKYQKIADKSAYLNTIIRKYDREEIEAEIRLNKWLYYIKDELKTYDNQPALLTIDPYGKKDMITITNDYALYDIVKQRTVTKKPSSTLKKINTWLEKGADVEFKALGRIYDDYLISYINLLPSN